MTGMVVAGILILLFLNISPGLFPQKQAGYISLNDVRGSAVFHNGKAFTLNFEEQTNLVDYLNRAVLVKKKDYSNPSKNFPFEKITLYLFKNADVEIFPIDSSNQNLVLNIPAWNQEFYFMDLSGGYLQKLLNSSFDP